MGENGKEGGKIFLISKMPTQQPWSMAWRHLMQVSRCVPGWETPLSAIIGRQEGSKSMVNTRIDRALGVFARYKAVH